jgi:hypothetical protein
VKRIRIQPSVLPDLSKPKPWIIRENGAVEDQDIWNGDPVALIGFQARVDVKTADLLRHDWMKDPQRAVGMYPVLVEQTDPDQDGKTYVYRVAVEQVEVLPDAPCEVITLPDGDARFYAICITHDCVQRDPHADSGEALREFECDKGTMWRFIVETDPDGPPHLVDLSRLKAVVRSARGYAVHNDDAHLRVWRWTGNGTTEELIVAHVPDTGEWVETGDRGDHHDRGPMAYPQFTVTGPDDTEYTRVTITDDGAA